MTSVLHVILEYWSRDYEVSSGWQRDPLYEGPVADAQLDPPDTVGEVLSAVSKGAFAILVKCTSRRNRYDLAGRITAAMASDRRVLAVYPEVYGAVVRGMLHGLVSNADVGHWKDGRQVTLADFSHVEDAELATIERIIVLAAPRRLNEAKQKVWRDAATRLSVGTGDRVRIELALAHSRWMIDMPDIVVQAGRMDGLDE